MRLSASLPNTIRPAARPAATAPAPVGGAMSAPAVQAFDVSLPLPGESRMKVALAAIASDALGFMRGLFTGNAGDWRTGLPPVVAPVAPVAPQPAPKPAKAAKPAKPAPKPEAGDKLKTMSAAELVRLGQHDKKGFFAALRPAAEAAERRYGVPAAVTMAQAALETGWGQHIIPGFNIFGIKGRGPAGTVKKGTWEVVNGRRVDITANFAKYHNFYEAVFEHGKLFHNGYYTKAMNNFKRYGDPVRFARDITGTYATDPQYGNKLISIMRSYDLI